MQNKTTQRNSLRKLSKLTGVLMICLILAGAFPAIVLARLGVIDTNNGAWDTNWGYPMRVDGDDAGVEDDLDIDTFWVNTDASTPTTYYFGVSTVAPLRMTDGVRICVLMDCNADGDVTDAADKALELNPGDTYYDVNGNSSIPWELNSPDSGEFIGRNVEARTNTTGSISWAACMVSNPVIKAQVRGGFCPTDGSLYDETVLRGYDLPTAVTLQNFSSGLQDLTPGTWLLAAGILGGLALAGAGFLLQRRRHRSG